ncbi:hypothetical protein Axi01nite_66740 [Actinoplanes xinjiangensis]|nr:hypothetical protein Axi01nite_66740 [Actinoplanes xinjiangensis]
MSRVVVCRQTPLCDGLRHRRIRAWLRQQRVDQIGLDRTGLRSTKIRRLQYHGFGYGTRRGLGWGNGQRCAE